MEKEIIITALAILEAITVFMLSVCNFWRAYWKSESRDLLSRSEVYLRNLIANKRRITALKEHLKAEKALNQQIHKELLKSQEELTAAKETLVDYETLILCKDEELEERDRVVGLESYTTRGVRENTRLIESLRSVVLSKCRLLKETEKCLDLAVEANGVLTDKLRELGVEVPKIEQVSGNGTAGTASCA
ncbi:MAG TPA: hypothetical protein PL124_10805, partial [Candidatus Cloacimonadota bacterium]|nr:hypothetical protein [Candidatus Cloacimonadota bacterium]